MPTLESIQTATQLPKLLGRVAAAVEHVATDALKNASGPTDPALLWAKRAWWTFGEKPLVQWYAQQCLVYAVHQSPQLQAAIEANKDDPQVTDAQITSFVQQFVAQCVALNI